MRLELFVALACVARAFAIWPRPRQLTKGSTALRLSPSFEIDLSGVKIPSKDLLAATTRSANHLRRDKLQALLVDRGASSAGRIKTAKSLARLSLRIASPGMVKSISDEAVAPLHLRNEGYTLTVPEDGTSAILEANTTLGLFRGLTTFEQLWYELNGYVYTLEAPFNVVDSPAYVSVTVATLVTHTRRWTAGGMGYQRLWDVRECAKNSFSILSKILSAIALFYAAELQEDCLSYLALVVPAIEPTNVPNVVLGCNHTSMRRLCHHITEDRTDFCAVNSPEICVSACFV